MQKFKISSRIAHYHRIQKYIWQLEPIYTDPNQTKPIKPKLDPNQDIKSGTSTKIYHNDPIKFERPDPILKNWTKSIKLYTWIGVHMNWRYCLIQPYSVWVKLGFGIHSLDLRNPDPTRREIHRVGESDSG